VIRRLLAGRPGAAGNSGAVGYAGAAGEYAGPVDSSDIP
jgi:hypothetical protein